MRCTLRAASVVLATLMLTVLGPTRALAHTGLPFDPRDTWWCVAIIVGLVLVVSAAAIGAFWWHDVHASAAAGTGALGTTTITSMSAKGEHESHDYLDTLPRS